MKTRLLSLILILSICNLGSVFSMDNDSDGEGKKAEPTRDPGKESDGSGSDGDGFTDMISPTAVAAKIAATKKAKAGGRRGNFVGGFRAAMMRKLRGGKPGAELVGHARGFTDVMTAPTPDSVESEANRALALKGVLNPMMLPSGGAVEADEVARINFLKKKKKAKRRPSFMGPRTTAAPAVVAPAPEVEADSGIAGFRVTSSDATEFSASPIMYQLKRAASKDDGDNVGEVAAKAEAELGRVRSASKDD